MTDNMKKLMEKVSADEALEGVSAFRGEYIRQYSWSERTLGQLISRSGTG